MKEHNRDLVWRACCSRCGHPVRGITRTGQEHKGHYVPTDCDNPGGWQWLSFNTRDPLDAEILFKLAVYDSQDKHEEALRLP